MNFTGETIYQVRVGWLDSTDWEPQKSPTGQMAGLKPRVYGAKLLDVDGAYYLDAPVEVADGIGAGTATHLNDAGLPTIREAATQVLQSGSLDSLARSLRDAGASRVAGRASKALFACPYVRTAIEYLGP